LITIAKQLHVALAAAEKLPQKKTQKTHTRTKKRQKTVVPPGATKIKRLNKQGK